MSRWVSVYSSPDSSEKEEEAEGEEELLHAVEREVAEDASAAQLSTSRLVRRIGRQDPSDRSSQIRLSPPRLVIGAGDDMVQRMIRESASAIDRSSQIRLSPPRLIIGERGDMVQLVIHESASATDRSMLIRKASPRSPRTACEEEGPSKRSTLGKQGPDGQELAPFAEPKTGPVVACDKTQEGNSVVSSRWPMMLPEILNEIQKYLSPKESTIMKVVCKNWYNCTPFHFLADHPMWFVPDNGRMWFGSPVHKRMFCVKQDHQLPSVEYMSASVNLVTFLEGNNVWVLNVTTGTLNKLPELEKNVELISQAISWNVVGDLFATFTVSGYAEEVTISLYWKPNGWVSKRYHCQDPFFPAENSAPVVKGDLVYCLGTNCQLGIFDLETRRWKVQPPRLTWPLLLSDSCHLTSTHNAINALIFNNEDCLHPPKILKLNLNRSEWDIMRSLGGESAFTGGLASSFIQSQGSFMRNRIYLPYSRGQYTLIEASIVVSEGLTFFRVEDKSGANLMFCWYLLDDTNVIKRKPGQPSKIRNQDSFIGDQELPHGTWVNFHKKNRVEEMMMEMMIPAGPPPRPN